jgi:hypothetical protein
MFLSINTATKKLESGGSTVTRYALKQLYRVTVELLLYKVEKEQTQVRMN